MRDDHISQINIEGYDTDVASRWHAKRVIQVRGATAIRYAIGDQERYTLMFWDGFAWIEAGLEAAAFDLIRAEEKKDAALLEGIEKKYALVPPFYQV